MGSYRDGGNSLGAFFFPTSTLSFLPPRKKAFNTDPPPLPPLFMRTTAANVRELKSLLRKLERGDALTGPNSAPPSPVPEGGGASASTGDIEVDEEESDDEGEF
jgi:hypothetical protein